MHVALMAIVLIFNRKRPLNVNVEVFTMEQIVKNVSRS